METPLGSVLPPLSNLSTQSTPCRGMNSAHQAIDSKNTKELVSLT